MKQFLLFLLVFVTSLTVFAQSKIVEGNVTDASDGSGIPGVNVLVVGTSKGVSTDIQGHYRVELAEGENSLSFSFIGYTTVSQEVGDRTTIDVALTPEVTALDEVVVVAYGTQKKSDLTGSVSSLRGGDLTKIPSLDPTMALQGKVAGVQVTNSSGAPGAQPIVRIRGVGTFNNASPIYVVDGVILEDIAFLNSNDIQSMEVLKDASATALYGSRGANGVILITTKQGKSGGKETLAINVTADYSIQNQQKMIDMLNGKQFAEYVNSYSPGTYNASSPSLPNTDWQKLIFRTAPIQNYQVSLSGSNTKVQYYVGVGYFKQEGIIPKSNYERLTIRVNNAYTLSKSVRFGNNLTFAPFQQQNTNGNVVYTAYRAQPIIAPYLANGGYSPVPGVGNPLADINYTNSYDKGLRTVGNFYGEVDFLKGFTFRSSFGVDMIYNKGKDFTPVFFVSPQQQNSMSILNKDWNDRMSWLWENTLNYNKEFGKNKVSALAGYTMQESSSEKVLLQGRKILRDGSDFWYINSSNIYPTANASNPDDDINAVDPSQNYSILSVLGRVNYTYDNRFLLTATFRRDGSSKFAKANRYGNFPSFAAGWNIINEQFMQAAPWVSNLKVRGSWGIIGNEKIDYRKQYSGVNNGAGAVLGGILLPGQTWGVIGNPNLKWETTYQTDIGLETGFLNDRLTVEVDYYDRVTKDILVNLRVPGYWGNGSGATVTYNAAQVLNRGFEVTANWSGKISDDLSYKIGANVTTINNRTQKVSGTGGSDDYLYGIIDGTTVTKTYPGVPIGSFFGYKTNGVFQNASQLASTPHTSDAGVGDLIYADTNNDGAVNEADRQTIGSPIPTLLAGLNLGATYKGFELSVDLTSVSGNKILNYKEMSRIDLYNFEAHTLNRWTAEGTSNTEPRANLTTYNFQMSDHFLQDGSFIRLRSVMLSYNFPKNMIGSKIKAARIYIRGTNLFTWSKFTGYTPEVASTDPLLNSIDRGTYPLPAVYSAGINVTF